tara:strand:+ start:197 stop:949 length:753 start_codon:yes stop_codon:yes gene_type:complete
LENNNNSPKISIVIPVHNEADNLHFLLNKIEIAMNNFIPYEIIIINDGSSDKTHEVIMHLNNQIKHLYYIQHNKQSGQSAALLSGVEASNSEWIVTLDGDGQNDPKDIIKLLMRRDEIDSDNLLLAGYRKKRKDSISKKIQSKIANSIRSFLLKDSTPDTGCGIKLFSKKLFLCFPKFNNMHRFLPALAIYFGAEVYSVEVNHLPRYKGVSHYGMWGRLLAGLFDIIGILWLKKRLIIREFSDNKSNFND